VTVPHTQHIFGRRYAVALNHAAGTVARRAFFLLLAVLFTVGHASSQTFKNPVLISTSSDPVSIAEADLNGDGKADLVYLDGSGPYVVHSLIGNGDGTFKFGQDITLPQSMGGTITIADVNNDGKPDVMIGGSQVMGKIGVFLGKGDGTFQPLIVSQFAASGSSFASLGYQFGVADFNADGAMDLAVSDALNSVVYVLLGNNTGSFTLKGALIGSNAPQKILTGDFNSDGHADIVVLGALSADATVYLGKGDGTFQTGVSYPGPNHITSIFLEDMDGDGHPDLVTSGFNNTISILHGNSDGTFAAASSGGTSNGGPGTVLVAVFDFNSDGILDLATAGNNGISILLGKGNLDFSAPVPYSGSPTPTPAVISDFNGDGHEDFAEVAPGGIALVFGAVAGTLASADVYDLGQGLDSVFIADFNGDTISDIAVNASQMAPLILLGQGKGKFSVGSNIGAGTGTAPISSMFGGDFNGDGKPDLLITGSGVAGTVFFGNGTGGFASPVDLNVPSTPTFGKAVVGDFNKDGKSDIAAIEYESLDILLGQSNNSFKVSVNNYALISGALAAADFNKDGKLDLVISQGGPNPLQVWLGNGDGTFKIGQQLAAVNLPDAVVTADLDGDGNIDIIADLGFFNLLQVFYGNGDGTFRDAVNVPIDRGYYQIALADMDGDGKPDFVLSDSQVLAVIRNLGNRTFGSEQHFLAGSIANFAVQDISGDGLPDIIVANGNGPISNGFNASTVTVLINQGAAKTVSGTLSVAPEPSPYAASFSINLAMAAVGSTSLTPTGTVAISIDDIPVATIPVNGLPLTYSDANTPPLPVGPHTVVATYSGDKNFLAGSFAVQHQVVPVLYASTTTLSTSLNSAAASQTVRFKATVTSPGLSANAPNPLPGEVVFRDGTTNLGTAPLNASGVAIFDTALLAAGSHSVTASYLGSAGTFQEIASFAPSTSAAVTVVVSASATTTTLTALPTSAQSGAIVSLTAVVASATGIPTGTVSFLDGTTPLGTQPLDAKGSAVFSATFASAATHVISASYLANGSFAASKSASVSVTVINSGNADQTSTRLNSSPDSLHAGSIVLSAAVAAKKGVPSGQVTFKDGSANLGVANLDGAGLAAYSVSMADTGLHYFTAFYSGNTTLQPSISPALLERSPLTTADFSLNLSATTIAIDQGASASVAASVTGINGFTGAVSLSCSVENSSMPCQLAPATLPKGFGTTFLSINAVPNRLSITGTMNGPRNLSGIGLTSAVVSLLGMMLLLFKRNRSRLTYASVCVFWAFSLLGCASAPSPSSASITPVGTYVVTVNATSANSGSMKAHSAQLRVEIQSKSMEQKAAR
jgi:Bacterial Ig-like domain (group 3)/FG-GAP-like repeat